jgi:hypothetical protein
VGAFVGTANMGAFVGTGNVGAGTCPPAGEQADTDARTIRAIVPISNLCFIIIVSFTFAFQTGKTESLAGQKTLDRTFN